MALGFTGWCILLLLGPATCVHSQGTCTVVTGEIAQLDVLYTTSGDTFFEASWYYRGTDGSIRDPILYYHLSSDFTEYYPPYDSQENMEKYTFVLTDTTFSLLITNASDSDLAVYRTEIVYDGGSVEKDVNVTRILPSEFLEEFYALVCGTRYYESDNNIQENCQSYSIFIPAGYNGPFSVDFYDGNSNVYNETYCDGVYPCTIVHNFTDSVPEMVTISIILEGLCTKEDPIAPYVFSFSSVVGSCRCWVFCIAEIICCSLKLCVIFPVCELVILKEEKKAANIRQRNMWIAVGVGVAVDIIVAVVDIVLSDCDECHVVVLGVNLGLALGCSAAFLIYAGLRHKTITDE